MDRNLLSSLSLYDGVSFNDLKLDEDIDFDRSQSELDSILNEIFSVDPLTGLPKGDLQYYFSKDGNPAVKDWLERNLVMPRSNVGSTSGEDVTDDLIHEFSRKSGESIDDYSLRLLRLRDEAMKNLQPLDNFPEP